jgi:hypothetical protein
MVSSLAIRFRWWRASARFDFGRSRTRYRNRLWTPLAFLMSRIRWYWVLR